MFAPPFCLFRWAVELALDFGYAVLRTRNFVSSGRILRRRSRIRIMHTDRKVLRLYL